jgi:peptidoglycan/LPS O-acetylase OafA/YrhL
MKKTSSLYGLRACAALLTLIFRLFTAISKSPNTDKATSNFVDQSLKFWQFGASGVHLFFVLSGFLLFMPYARALLSLRAFPNSLEFYIRRALRILPAYWLALVVMLLLLEPTFLRPNYWYDIGLHLLIIHNWSQGTIRDINIIFWTMPVEVQFYLLLPATVALLLRLFRAKAYYKAEE